MPYLRILLCLICSLGMALAVDSGDLSERYWQILEKNPANETALNRLEELHRAAGTTGQLQSRLEDLAKSNSKAVLPLAEFLQRNGSPDQALDLLETLETKDWDASSHLRLGTLFERLGRQDLAAEAWENAITLEPENHQLRRKIAKAAMMANNPMAARNHWEFLAEQATPELRLEALEELSVLEEQIGDAAEAHKLARKALDLLSAEHWKTPEILQRTLRTAKAAGLLDELAAEWELPQTRDRFRRMAALHAVRGDLKEQEVWLEKAREADPKNTVILRELASLQRATGNREGARKSYGTLLELEPGNETTLESFASLTASLQGEDAAAELITRFFETRFPDGSGFDRKAGMFRSLHLNSALGRALKEKSLREPGSPAAAIEYAAFLFEQGKKDEALQVIGRFPPEKLARAGRTADLLAFARFLTDLQLYREAEPWTSALVLAVPHSTEALLLESSRREAGSGQAASLDYLLSKFPSRVPAPIEVDQRILTAMQKKDSEINPDLKNTSSRAFAGELERNAAGNPVLWERAARWQSWTGESQLAIESLGNALKASPESPALLQSLAMELEKTGEVERAIETWDKLNRISRSPEQEIRLARLEVIRGNPEAAIATLQNTLATDPSFEVLREFARAQEAAGLNFEALNTWEKVFAMASPAEKSNMLAPLLRQFQRVGAFERAIRFLAAQASAMTDPRMALEILRTGNSFARETSQLTEWKTLLEQKGTSNPGSVAWQTALAEISPNPAPPKIPTGPDSTEAMELLVQDAMRRGRMDEALELSKKLAEDPSATREILLRHVEIMEKAGSPADDITARWEELLERHSRSPEVLLGASGWFERSKDENRAMQLLRASSELIPLPVADLLRLARHSMKTDRAVALGDFQNLLARFPSDPDKGRNPPPFPSRLEGRPQVPIPNPEDPQGARLLAMHSAGYLLRNTADLEKELRQLTTQPMELVHGFVGAGQPRKAMKILGTMTSPDPSNITNASFAALGLENHAYAEILAWTQSDPQPPFRWTVTFQMLAALAGAGWDPGEDIVAFLKNAPPFVHWRSADILGSSGHVRLATEIGLPEIAYSEASPETRIRMASWKLATRDLPGAKEGFVRALTSGPVSTTFEDAWYPAFRALWMLETPDKRPELEEIILAHASKSGPVATAAVRALIADLHGDPVAFETHARAWLEGHLTTPETHMMLAVQAATVFESWHREHAARTLFRIARVTSPALSTLSGGPPTREGLDNAIFSSLLLESTPAEAGFLVKEWKARGASKDQLSTAAHRAAGHNRMVISRILHEECFLEDPADPAAWTALASLRSFEEARSDLPLTWFTKAPEKVRSGVPENAVLLFANTLENEGNGADALRLLRAVPKESPANLLHEARNRLQKAMEGTAKNPDTTSGAPQLADLLSSENPLEILEAWEESTPGEGVALAGEIIAHKPDWIVALAGTGTVERMLAQSSKTPAFRERALRARLEAAFLDGSQEAFIHDMDSLWDSGQGPTEAGEVLLEAALRSKDTSRIQKRLEALRTARPGSPKAPSWAASLMEYGHALEALKVFEDLDKKGIVEHSVALARAEALWKTGRRAEALDAARLLELSAKIDPAVRISLAAFYLSVDRPDAAIKHMDALNRTPVMERRFAVLRAHAAKILLNRGRDSDAHLQLALAIQMPGTIPPEILAEYLAKQGTLENPDKALVSLGLSPGDIARVVPAIAARLRKQGNSGAALRWLETYPEAAATEAGLVQLLLAGETDPESMRGVLVKLRESRDARARTLATRDAG